MRLHQPGERIIGTWLQVLILSGLLAFVLPACAETYAVGSGQPYRTLAALPALHPGDSVEIHSGTYHEFKRWTDNGTADRPITVRGVGATRPLFDGTGLVVRGEHGIPRALFQIEGDHYVIEDIEFKNARNQSWNGAGIRVTGAKSTTIRRCKITYCDMGFMSNANDDLRIEHCEIAFNGNKEHYDGYSHNLYLEGKRTTVQDCYIHDALAGVDFKSRGQYTELLNNILANGNDGEMSLVESEETVGPRSDAVLIGNMIYAKVDRDENANHERFINFGHDMGGKHNGTLFVVGNTFVAGDPRNIFLSVNTAEARIYAFGNTFRGSDHILAADPSQVQGAQNRVPPKAVVPPGFAEAVPAGSPFVPGGEK